jgi:hypothetical protein
MNKIRFIFFSVFIAFSVFAVSNEKVNGFHHSLQEFVDVEELSFESSEHEVENEVGYIKNSRRTTSNNNESLAQKAFYQFYQFQFLELREKNKSVYKASVQFYQSEEISFLHRFRLF